MGDCVEIELFWGRLSGGLISETKSDVQTNEVDILTQLVAPAESAKTEAAKPRSGSSPGRHTDSDASISAMTAGSVLASPSFLVIFSETRQKL